MNEHQHGPECDCSVSQAGIAHYVDVPASKKLIAGHVCDPYCYHNRADYKLKMAKFKRRATHEKVWNPVLGRVRSPYPRQPVVPLHLLGVVPLVVPEDAPVPSPEQIQEAQKEHRRRRNARRRARK